MAPRYPRPAPRALTAPCIAHEARRAGFRRRWVTYVMVYCGRLLIGTVIVKQQDLIPDAQWFKLKPKFEKSVKEFTGTWRCQH